MLLWPKRSARKASVTHQGFSSGPSGEFAITAVGHTDTPYKLPNVSPTCLGVTRSMEVSPTESFDEEACFMKCGWHQITLSACRCT